MSEKVDGAKLTHKTLSDGTRKSYYYCRVTGDPLGTDPERARREILLRANAAANIPVLSHLIRDYEASPDWTRLAASTKAVGRFHPAAIEDEFGDMPLTVVEAKGSRSLFLDWHADLAVAMPRAADMKLGRLQTILHFGCDREQIARNPLATFKRAYRVDRSEVIWLPEHFAALNASNAALPMKFAAFLGLHTGQRRGDLISLLWRQYDCAGISLVQSKTRKLGTTGRLVYVPATSALKKALDQLGVARVNENHGADIGGHHILTTSNGRAYTSNAFRLAWQRAFVASGIEKIDIDGQKFALFMISVARRLRCSPKQDAPSPRSLRLQVIR